MTSVGGAQPNDQPDRSADVENAADDEEAPRLGYRELASHAWQDSRSWLVTAGVVIGVVAAFVAVFQPAVGRRAGTFGVVAAIVLIGGILLFGVLRRRADAPVALPVATIVAATVIAAVAGGWLVWPTNSSVASPPDRPKPSDSPPAPDASTSPSATPSCPSTRSSGPEGVEPLELMPEVAGRYRFCYVRVNDGRPITSVRYGMAGYVVGQPPPPGRELALLGTADSGTCDENGGRGTDGYFLKARIRLQSGSEPWRATGSYAYDEGRTLRIVYVFVEAPSTAIDQIERAQRETRDPDYPGFGPPSGDVQVLAQYAVQAVEPPADLRCG